MQNVLKKELEIIRMKLWQLTYINDKRRKINLEKKNMNMIKQTKTVDNKNTNRYFPEWVSTLIVIISILDVLFIIALFVLFFFDKISLKLFEKAAESSLLSSGIAVVGIAIAVWAGLNISNAIERKELEKLKVEYGRLNKNSTHLKNKLNSNKDAIKRASKQIRHMDEDIKRIKKKEASVDKSAFLKEMYDTLKDPSTRLLIEKIRVVEAENDIQFLSLLQIERLFNSVYQLHSNEARYDTGLLLDAAHGISLSEQLLQNENLDHTIQKYLKYRIADFHFYSGYCCEYSERKRHFDEAVKIYIELHDFFDAQLPEYDQSQQYSAIGCKKCSKEHSEISAYYCNAIGESYSKIIQIKDYILSTDEEINEYGLKAIFYCAYAAEWGNRETYWRNLGCAIERHYGVLEDNIDELLNIYNHALILNATPSTFKVYLSVCDKYVNNSLGLKNVDITKGRDVPLSDHSYQDKWNNIEQPQKEKVKLYLSNISEKSSIAKTVYPLEDVGYTYSCIYYRDMCLINADREEIVKEHLYDARNDLKVLNVINPNGVLTKILNQDIESLIKRGSD